MLLAIDMGLRTGLALYGDDGRLLWYRSQNFGTPARLKRGAHSILKDLPDVTNIVIEGGGHLADIWEKEAVRRGLVVMRTRAEEWREKLLYQREQRSGAKAKRTADDIARRVIEWSGAHKPTSLRHDAAEAILVGLWGLVELGWLKGLPEILHERK
jgi:hypothetical protein